MSRTIQSILFCITSLGASNAFAGPPLNTGDTDILDPGSLEVIVSATADERDAGDSFELPGLEVAYGLSENTQAAIILSRAVIDEPGASSKSDFGPMGLEYAWRFYNDGNVTVATAPAYTFPVNGSSQDRGITDSTRELGIPLIATYAGEGWFVTGETSYAITSSGPNGLGYGLATGYEFSDKFTGLAEVNGGKIVGGGGPSERELLWRIGGTYMLSEQYTLLFAYGGDLNSSLPSEAELDRDWYLGIQYNTP